MLCSRARCASSNGVLKAAWTRFGPGQRALARRTLSSRPGLDGPQGADGLIRIAAVAGILLAGSYHGWQHSNPQETSLEAASSLGDDNETTTLLNWSGTHAVVVRNDSYWEPETEEELEAIVKHCHENKRAVRPLGSALSPNGIGFHPEGMVGLTNLDKIIKIDQEAMTVTAQAGARVSQVRAACCHLQL